MVPNYPKESLRGQNGELYRARWKSVDKIASLRREVLCFRCERKGCLSRICPLLPAVNPKILTKLPPIDPNVYIFDDENVCDETIRVSEKKYCVNSVGIKLDYKHKKQGSSKNKVQVNTTVTASQELEMNTPPFLVNALLNDFMMVQALVDSGCLCSGIIDDALATRLKLPRTNISPRTLETVEDSTKDKPVVNSITYVSVDLDGIFTPKLWLYVVTAG